MGHLPPVAATHPRRGAVRGGVLVPDQFDMTVTDPELLAELELCADLMVAANASESALSLEAIDCIVKGRPADAERNRVWEGVPPPRPG
jgi:hypothetical protein